MSYGQKLAGKYLRETIIGDYIENHRPDWLNGMELDFYYPQYYAAFEFNGDQHYHPTSFGHHHDQRVRDKLKKEICEAMGIRLVTIDAIHLQTSVIRRKAKMGVGQRNLKRQAKLGWLSKECVEYRKTLIAKYNSPTAMGDKGKKRREAVRKNWREFFQIKPPNPGDC